VEAFATLIPLYPTTTRPFVGQIRTAIRRYLAPTLADEFLVPESLRSASRRLAITLHFTAPKAGGADDWTRLLSSTVKQFHSTADQVFRAVQETWDAPAGYVPSKVVFGEEPTEGSDAPETLPTWTGITPGSQRLVGLFAFMSDFLRYPTKAQVPIPVGQLVDVVSRVSQIARHSPKTQTWEQSLEINPSVSKDERDELWSAIPCIHAAALELLLALCRRLRTSFVPVAPEALDYLVRVQKSGIGAPAIRRVSYELLGEILALSGLTMTKETVTSLELIISACCRDIQQEHGSLKEAKPVFVDPKKHGVAMNADLFLAAKKTETSSPSPTLPPAHLSAAENLLAALLQSLPQRHLRPAHRGLLDQTAILSQNKDAMFASVLNPFRNQQGRVYPSILPFLSQMHPRDQGLEVLRSNIRSSAVSERPVSFQEEPEEEAGEDVEMAEDEEVAADEPEAEQPAEQAKQVFEAVPLVDRTPKVNPFELRKGEAPLEVKDSEDEAEEVVYAKAPSLSTPPQQHKRKNEGGEVPTPAKKMDLGHPPEVTVEKGAAPAGDDSDDSDVELVASFDSDPEDE
ncbi:hypothetical protein IMZ48_35720, partial [Candidatus Bathyarchaeota archaeon]|nr:hypothetical protein [Candidatus Bathyarchaeota archaeon]